MNLHGVVGFTWNLRGLVQPANAMCGCGRVTGAKRSFNLVRLSITNTQQASPISSMFGFGKRMKYFKACINNVSRIKQLWNYDTVVSSPVASCENQKADISFGLADCCDSRRHIRELPRCSKVTLCRQICVGHKNSFMLQRKPDVQRWKPKGQRSSHLVNDCHFNHKFINSTCHQSNKKSAFWC